MGGDNGVRMNKALREKHLLLGLFMVVVGEHGSHGRLLTKGGRGNTEEAQASRDGGAAGKEQEERGGKLHHHHGRWTVCFLLLLW